MHEQVMEYLKWLKYTYRTVFECQRVLECGSLIVNGSPRELFKCTAYVGVDVLEGPGVDVVSRVDRLWEKFPRGSFDTVISTEMLEHDPYWWDSLASMVEMTRVGGSLIITYADADRPVHETWASPQPGYYHSPPVRSVVARVMECGLFRHMEVQIRKHPSDAYLFLTDKI